MRTLLEELWYGNVYPQEHSTEHNSEISVCVNSKKRKCQVCFYKNKNSTEILIRTAKN